MSTDDIIMVDFLDHAENLTEPITCRVYGRLIDQSDLHLVVETWTMTDPEQEERIGDSHCFTIIKAAITQAKTLWTPPPS